MNDPIFVFEDSFVFKSNDLDSKALKKPSPLLIIDTGESVEMWLPVKFNAEALRRAIEIQNVSTDTMLPSEFFAVQLGVLNDIPKCRFGRRQTATEFRTKRL